MTYLIYPGFLGVRLTWRYLSVITHVKRIRTLFFLSQYPYYYSYHTTVSVTNEKYIFICSESTLTVFDETVTNKENLPTQKNL